MARHCAGDVIESWCCITAGCQNITKVTERKDIVHCTTPQLLRKNQYFSLPCGVSGEHKANQGHSLTRMKSVQQRHLQQWTDQIQGSLLSNKTGGDGGTNFPIIFLTSWRTLVMGVVVDILFTHDLHEVFLAFFMVHL